MNKFSMKKLLSILLCIALIAALALSTVGCSKNDNTAPATTAEASGVVSMGEGETSFLFNVVDPEGKESHFEIHTDEKTVGAALLTKSGKVYLGCNIENAAYGPSNCAERTAIFKAVSEGEREFAAIAVVGGKNGDAADIFPPCGVCRQVMMEFCDPETFIVLLGKGDKTWEEYTLAELLPLGFSSKNLGK